MNNFLRKIKSKKTQYVDIGSGELSKQGDALTREIFSLTQTLTQLQRLDPNHVEFANISEIVGDKFSTDQQAHTLREQFISGHKAMLDELDVKFVRVAKNLNIDEATAKGMLAKIKESAVKNLDIPQPSKSL